MKRLKQVISLFAAVCFLMSSAHWPTIAQQRRTITVRSLDSGYFYYRVDTGNTVRLIKQLSKGVCDYQRSWGYDHRGVWVDRGCEGEFEVIGDGAKNFGNMSADGRKEIYLYSPNNRYYRYEIATESAVELKHRFSQSLCKQGQDWGFDGNGVWVDHGCSAEFLVGRKRVGDNSGLNTAMAGVISGGVVLGMLMGSRPDSDSDTTNMSAPQREAYKQGRSVGRRDAEDSLKKDYQRYRGHFDVLNESFFKNGYENGFESVVRSGDTLKRKAPVPSWLVGRFRGFDSTRNADVEMSIYSEGSVYVRVNGEETISGSYRGGQVELADSLFNLARERDGFRTTQVGAEKNQVSFKRVF